MIWHTNTIKLHPKRDGEHRWVAIVTHRLPRYFDPYDMGPFGLDNESVVAFGVGCWDCEQSWDQGHQEPCYAKGERDEQTAT